MHMLRRFITGFGLAVVCSVAIAAAPASKTFDPAPHSQAVTGCDRLAAHPEDPFKVVPGLDTADVDFAAAIAACRVAVARDAGNPRLVYQLARALTYAGEVKEGLPLVEQAAALKYPQALFVAGYLYLEGFAGAPKDPCRAAELMRESAVYGRRAGVFGFAAFALEGRFNGCASEPDKREIAAFLEAAKSMSGDYYQGLLVTALERQAASRQDVD